MALQMLTLTKPRLASTARRKSKAKSQKSKLTERKRFVDLEWVVYFRRALLDVKQLKIQ